MFSFPSKFILLLLLFFFQNHASPMSLVFFMSLDSDFDKLTHILRRSRLRWFGHLERKSPDDWVSASRDLEVDGVKRKGRSRKTWGECVRNDIVSLGLKRNWALDRVRWRGFICGNRPTHV